MAFNFSKKPYIIYCSRCGSEYSSDSRYCMKCGNLNPDHPQNKDLSKLIKEEKPGFIIGGGKPVTNVNANEVNGKASVNVVKGNNTGNFDKCFVINALIYFGITLSISLIYAFINGFDIISISYSNLYSILIPFSIIFILFYSVQLVFMKLDRPWWSGLIPIYNNAVLADVFFKKPILGYLTIIPIVGQLIQLYLWYKLGSKFKKSGLFTALFPLIMFPVIGFGGAAYDGVCYVSNDNTLEKEFKKKNIVLTGCFLFAFLGSAMFIYSHFDDLVNGNTRTANIYFVMSSKIIEKSLDSKIENKEIKCTYGTSGTLYFYFADISEHFFIPLSVFFDTISATVKVEQTPVGRMYYISMTNGTEGFPETLSSYISSSSVEPHTSVDKSYKDYGCRIKTS